MDGIRFDTWTRRIATVCSRRTMLRAAAGGALAALLAAFRPEEATAACRKPGQKCKTKKGMRKKCCDGAKCRGKRCKCPASQEACGKRCCRPGHVCTGGKCVLTPQDCPTDGRDTCNEGYKGGCAGDPNCRCYTTTQGATRCGNPASGSGCATCTTDDDCVQMFGTLAFCAEDTGPGCGCSTGQGFCKLPCTT